MQAETMPVLAGSESMIENASKVLARNSHSIIHHRNADKVAPIAYPNGELLILTLHVLAGILGVAYQVHQYLQDLVLIGADLRNCFILADDFDLPSLQAVPVHAQGI